MHQRTEPDLNTLANEARLAESRIRPYIRETPLEHSPFLSHEIRGQVFLKLENLQLTGSFKLRGAMNKILSLSKAQRERSVVTASSGNHGHAFAYLSDRFGFPGIVYLPETTDPGKVETLKAYGVDIRIHGDDCVRAEAAARAAAADQGFAYVPPYNDLQIIAGQATVGTELSIQAETMDAILVPVGGGGLISGIAGYLKSQNISASIYGCQPANSRVMYESLKAGRILDLESLPTLSDGTAGGIESDSLTFPLCRDHVDGFFLLSEEEIRAALKLVIAKHHILIEGAAALPVAALLKERERFKGQTVVLVLSGATLSLATLKKIL
ncbi:MAG: threonine/serine dehydratase [Candidatus Aminicenantaceae bacterium]